MVHWYALFISGTETIWLVRCHWGRRYSWCGVVITHGSYLTKYKILEMFEEKEATRLHQLHQISSFRSPRLHELLTESSTISLPHSTRQKLYQRSKIYNYKDRPTLRWSLLTTRGTCSRAWKGERRQQTWKDRRPEATWQWHLQHYLLFQYHLLEEKSENSQISVHCLKHIFTEGHYRN